MEIKKAKKGPPFQYEAAFKRKVVEELYSGQITKAELCRKYNLHYSSAMRFAKWYDKEQKELLSLQDMEPNSNPLPSEPAETKSQKELEEELRLAKMKIIGLETMIDLAEDIFKIDIRKKSGTKPSSE